MTTPPRYIRLTAASDGTDIRVRTDQVLGMHTADARRPANFVTGDDQPGETVVTVSYGTYRVKETQIEVVRKMAGLTTKGKS
jgi:hypothetical protein